MLRHFGKASCPWVTRTGAGRDVALCTATVRYNWKNTIQSRHVSVSATSMKNIYDIVIIGGGVAGTALACALAANPRLKHQRVALVEAMDLKKTLEWVPEDNKFSNRCVSLTPASMAFFENIGVGKHLHQSRVNGYRDMEVWDGVSGARISFDAAALGLTDAAQDGTNPSIAYMIENVHLQNAILQRLKELQTQKLGAEVTLLENARVASIEKTAETLDEEALDLSDWPTVQLGSGDALKARLLIGADGVNSLVRNFADIESLGWDYDTHGVVATVRLDPDRPNNTAWQRFLPTGPIAMLPLNDEYASMVWSTKPALAKMLKSVSAKDFCHLINAAYRNTPTDLAYLYSQINKSTHVSRCDIGAEYAWREEVATKSLDENDLWQREHSLPPQVIDVQEGTRASFPLKLRNSERYVTDRIALVGDAAHATHPLAGQGLNQGLLDVESISNVIATGVSEGQDLGSIHLLRHYAADRYVRNIAMISACDKLHRLFGTDATPVVWLRSLGLSTVNSLDFVKTEIMKYAMGIEYNGQSRRST